jgi:hypothetical protein
VQTTFFLDKLIRVLRSKCELRQHLLNFSTFKEAVFVLSVPILKRQREEIHKNLKPLERRFTVRKTVLVVCLTAIVLLLGSSIVLAADVVVGIQKPAVIERSSEFIVQVSLTNDQTTLNGFQITLRFYHETNNDIRCDSIQWTSRVTSNNPDMYAAGQAGDVSYLHNDEAMVVVWAVLPGEGLPPGEGPICNLYFTAGSNWDSNVPLTIDLTDKLDPPGAPEVSDSKGLRLPVTLKVNEGGNSGDVGGATLPAKFELLQNYPNPFNPATTIEFNLPKAGQVTVDIYNARGQKVKSYERDCSPGTVRIVWNGEDNRGNPVASGTYFYQVSANGEKLAAKKMILVK